MQRAATLRKAGKWEESLALLQQYIRAQPDDAGALHDLGITLLHFRRLPAAIASLQRAAALKPDFARTHYQLAIALQEQGRETEAVAALRRAVALQPRLAEAQGRLGDFLYTLGDRAAARACFLRAAAAAPHITGGRLSRARAFLAEGNFAEGEKQLRRAIVLDSNSGPAHWILGRTLSNVGRFAEAAVEFERAIALDPNNPSIYHDLFTAKRITEADRPMVAKVQAALETPGLGQGHRVGLQYALGKAFDDLGEYAEAMRHFDEANRLNRGLVPFDRAGLKAENDRAMARFMQARLASLREYGADDEMPLLIVGMPRSGTTLVEQILSAHPGIGAGEEQNFWNMAAVPFVREGAGEVAPAHLGKTAHDYLALLRRLAPGALRVTDKMPTNFRWLGQIQATFPRARIIHCRRHPIDTCLSNYFAYFGQLHPYTCSRSNLVFYYREYLRLMDHWRAILTPDRLLEIDYEELVADREPMTRRLIAFTGLDWDDACLTPERNERVVYTASSWQARQPVYKSSVQRWRHYEPWLGELRELQPASSAV
ncbi:MAG: sulfotransferase [Acetobacteraceae bacterium]